MRKIYKIGIFVLLMLGALSPLAAQQQSFPYTVVINTVTGDCFNNCQAVVTLYDAQGNLIQTDDSLQQPVNTAAYPITNLQYHYKNQLYNSVFYSNSHVLTVDMGTYDIGVSGQVMVQSGSGQVLVLVDTTFYGITLTSTYTPFSASVLAGIADNDYISNGVRRERCGNRYALPCGDRGRVQMKLTSGNFPYTVIFFDEQDDTVRNVVFNHTQHSGTDSLFADYKDYYTIDSLPAGTYRIVAYDACSYSSVFHHTVELNDVQISYLNFKVSPPNTSDSNIVRFAPQFYRPKSVHNYDYDFFESIFQYRFIHSTDSNQIDTSSWRPIDGSSVSSMYNGIYCDTLDFASRYCDLYGHTVQFEVRDLCHQDTVSLSLTLRAPDTTCYVTDRMDDGYIIGPVTFDTCSQVIDAAVSYTLMYRIWYDCGHSSGYSSSIYSSLYYYTYPLYWVYTDMSTGQVIKTEEVSEMTSISTLTNVDVESVYGTYTYLPLPITRQLVDAHGCVLKSRFDTLLFVRDTVSGESPYQWDITANFNRYNYSSCFSGQRTITVYETPTPFPLYRDSTVVRLIQSPLYNKYNFTATYAQGAWTIVKDDTVNNDADIIANGMNVSIRNSRLSGGLYVFVCETICGSDTVRIDIDGIYYDMWEWIEEPAYEAEQECNDLLVTPVAGKYRRYTYHIDSQISNDEPVVTFYDYYPNIYLQSGVVGGYSYSSTSMNVPFRFTIPGEYVVKMSFWGCSEEYVQIDTIDFVRVRVDFEKAYAVMCDSTSNTGTVIARAFNGSTPYTYKLYSQPDIHGSLLGNNQSGVFNNVPMNIGQELSVQVTDSCENSFSINLVAMSLSQSQLLWFEGGTPVPGACVGDTVTLEALPINSSITYSWNGPGNFVAIGEQISYYVADTSYKGWLVVNLLNTGCPSTVKDSIYLNVLYPPQVFVSAVDTACAGDTIQVNFTALGTEMVYFDMHRFFAGEHSSQSLSVMSQDTLSLLYPIESDNFFWVSQASDMYCPGHQNPDTVQVSIYPNVITEDTVHISAEDLLVCYGSDAELSVTSDLNSPCILNWYDYAMQSAILQQDTLFSAGAISTYTIPQLIVDTTLYAIVWYQDNCPAHIGRSDLWKKMQNGTTIIQSGQGVRFYDSGGDENPYQNNETLSHTFQSPNSEFFLLRFHSLELSEGDTLFVYSQGGSLIGSYTGTQLPANIPVAGSSFTFNFVSDQSDTAAGWSVDVLTPAALTAVSASVVRFFDTLALTVCQTDEPFSFPPFSQINIADTGVFQLDTTLASVMGCDSSVSLTIYVLPVKSSTLDTVICEGHELVIGSHSYTQEGTYLCNLTADNGCDSVVTLQLDVIESSTEVVSSEDDFCEHYTTILSLSEIGEDYIWNTGEQSPYIEVFTPGTYTVTTHYQGCEVTASYVIKPCQWELYLPNAITPGKPEGLNDVFCLAEDQKNWIEEFELYIFNRWGELVYSAMDKNFKWDGSVKGQLFPNAVYSYVIYLTDRNGRRLFYKGSIITLG